MRISAHFSPRWTLLALLLALGCGDDEASTGEGSLAVLLQAEETITAGLTPGVDVENIRDGWSVSFGKYLVAIGGVSVGSDANRLDEQSGRYRVVDLKKVPPQGTPFETLSGLPLGKRPYFGYSLVHAQDAERDDTVSRADYEAMVEADATFLISGKLTKADGESCPPGEDSCRATSEVTFELLVAQDVTFGPCELDGIAGVTIVRDSKASVGLTLHGDHLFFNAFPFGDELLERRAQWLVNADLDGDDRVDAAELASISGVRLAELLPSDTYSLGGWTAFPIDTALDFARAQLATQGHYQGEGECVWSVNGVSGEHAHEDDAH